MSILKKIFKRKNKKRNFEGAARTPRTSRWKTTTGDANSTNDYSLPVLRRRSRDLRRNNPYFNRAITGIANNTIGKGISTQIVGAGANKLSVESTWNLWTKSPEFD